MQRLTKLTVLVLVASFAVFVSAEEKKITKEETPKPVVATLDKLVPGATIDKYEAQMGDDAKDKKLSYEIDGSTTDGKAFRFIISPEGKVFERWDRKVKLEDVSPEVK